MFHRSFFEVAGGARAGGPATGVAAAPADDVEPLEAGGAWGDDDDVLDENKVRGWSWVYLHVILRLQLDRPFSIELKTEYLRYFGWACHGYPVPATLTVIHCTRLQPRCLDLCTIDGNIPAPYYMGLTDISALLQVS